MSNNENFYLQTLKRWNDTVNIGMYYTLMHDNWMIVLAYYFEEVEKQSDSPAFQALWNIVHFLNELENPPKVNEYLTLPLIETKRALENHT